MTPVQLATLVAEVKGYLGITWDDEITHRQVEGFVSSSIAYINGKLPKEADFSVPGAPRDLLMDRCRYMRDGALDVFEQNYLGQILAMQHGEQVKQYAQSTLSEQQ